MSWGSVQVKEVKTDVGAGRLHCLFDAPKSGHYWVILHCGIFDTSATAATQNIETGIIQRPPIAGQRLADNLVDAMEDNLNPNGYIRTAPGSGVASGNSMVLLQSDTTRQTSPFVGTHLMVVPDGWRFMAWESNQSHSAANHQLTCRIVYLEIPNERCIPFV